MLLLLIKKPKAYTEITKSKFWFFSAETKTKDHGCFTKAYAI